MGIWQKRLGNRARWWNTGIKVHPTQVHEQMGHPVLKSLKIAPETFPRIFHDFLILLNGAHAVRGLRRLLDLDRRPLPLHLLRLRRHSPRRRQLRAALQDRGALEEQPQVIPHESDFSSVVQKKPLFSNRIIHKTG